MEHAGKVGPMPYDPKDRERAIGILSELAIPVSEGRIQMLVDIFRVWRQSGEMR